MALFAFPLTSVADNKKAQKQKYRSPSYYPYNYNYPSYRYGRKGGEILLEEEQKIYEESQDEAIRFLNSLQSRITELQRGKTIKEELKLPSNNCLKYLAGANLFCAARSGTCSIIPEAVFEADLMNSFAAKKTSCPLTTQFWGFWASHDMDLKLSELLSTGLITQVDDYNKNQRPSLINCEETINSIVRAAGGTITDSSMRTRYSQGSRLSTVASKTAALIEMIRQKADNIFLATGLPANSISSKTGKTATRMK